MKYTIYELSENEDIEVKIEYDKHNLVEEYLKSRAAEHPGKKFVVTQDNSPNAYTGVHILKGLETMYIYDWQTPCE